MASLAEPISTRPQPFNYEEYTLSHIVTIKTEIRDGTAVHSACQRLKLPPPIHGDHRLFSTQVTGLGVTLPDWRFPVVCQLDTGQLHYDHYNGRWGEIQHLEKFQQAYAVEKAKLEARRRGHSVAEHALADGSIRLTIQVGGAA